MDAKRREIAPFARPVMDEELAAFGRRVLPPGFRRSLDVPGRLTVIAEVKRASPSVGTIKTEADAVAQACRYAEAGADCLSVLTETTYFQGRLSDLTQVVADQGARPHPCPASARISWYTRSKSSRPLKPALGVFSSLFGA